MQPFLPITTKTRKSHVQYDIAICMHGASDACHDEWYTRDGHSDCLIVYSIYSVSKLQQSNSPPQMLNNSNVALSFKIADTSFKCLPQDGGGDPAKESLFGQRDGQVSKISL